MMPNVVPEVLLNIASLNPSLVPFSYGKRLYLSILERGIASFFILF